MKLITTCAQRLLLSAGLVCALEFALPTAAHADTQSLFVPFDGAGNVSAFDASSGGWVGSIDQTPPPVVANPLALVSVVLFQLNAATQTLSGSFEFTTTDLLSSLYGEVNGSYGVADILSQGGQFSLDYNILGGTGAFASASGFGLAFLNYDPNGGFNNYTESGLLNVTVPEPASVVLAGLGLAMLAISRRRPSALRTRVNRSGQVVPVNLRLFITG